MVQALRRNFGLKLFSFALAVAGWAFFRFAAAPSITAQFDQQISVPITVTGLLPGYAARFSEKQALVTVVPPRSGEAIKPDQVKAVLNLEQRAGGVYAIPIQIIAPDIQVSAISPSSVTLTIDQLVERSFPLAVSYTGAREGVVVSKVQLDPQSVLVRGTATDLAKIQAIRLDVPLGASAATFDAMIRPVASAPGVDAGALVISPNLVRVRAAFSKGQSGG